MSSETILQERVANYLAQNYPDVRFHSDFGSGADLSKKQAALQSRQNARRRGWPDLTIACGRQIQNDGKVFQTIGRVIPKWQKLRHSNGLYLELKKDGETLYPGPQAKKRYKSKDGKEYKTSHLREQADVLDDLRSADYCAEFAIGYDEALRFIHAYLGEPRPPKVEF